MQVPIPPHLGLYDQVLDRLLEAQLAAPGPDRVQVESEVLDPADAHAALAEHLRRAAREALQGLTGDDRARAQVELCNQVVGLLQKAAGEHLAARAVVGGRRLLSLRKAEAPPPSGPTPRPGPVAC